jgi:hypothetical protein
VTPLHQITLPKETKYQLYPRRLVSPLRGRSGAAAARRASGGATGGGDLERRPPGEPREEQLAGCGRCGCIFGDGEVIAFARGSAPCLPGIEEISDDSPTPQAEPEPYLTKGEASDLLAAFWADGGTGC